MALTPEQVKELKMQLSGQIQHLSPEQKAAAQKQIDSLSPEALELMIKQQQSKQGKAEKGLFRSIVDGEIKSYFIAENKDSIAVLDIKPISSGHCIIIPKKPVVEAKSLPNSCFNLAKKIAKKASKKLNAKSSEIQTEYKFGEMIINIIPIYDKSLNILSPRNNPTEKELEEISSKLKIIKKPRKIKIKRETNKESSSVPKLERKIP
jgi:histidine triad (HIT) family protein